MLQLWRQTTELTSKGLKEKDAVQKEIGSDTGTNRFNSVEESCDRTCGLTTTAS